MKRLKLENVVFNLVMAFLLAIVAMTVAPAHHLAVGATVGGGVLALGCLAQSVSGSAAFMAVQREIWVDTIEENIYPNNSFMMQSRDDGAFLEGKTVKLNQAGGKPAVQKNRAVLPATAAKRVDSTADYDIDEYTTDPIVVQKTEEIEASYGKRQSVMFDHTEVLKTKVAEGMAYSWSPTLGVNIIRTTGAARPGYKVWQLGVGAVQRKRITQDDIMNAAAILNSQDVPQEGRFMLIDSMLVQDLLKIEAFTSLEKIGKAVLVDGAIGRIGGFDVFVRSSTTVYDVDDNTKKDFSEAVSIGDNVSCLFWQKNFVRRCFGGSSNGGIEVFEDSGSNGNGNPLFYGTVISALVRSGGRAARADERGIVALVEAHA
ncbi:phage capsid protein [Hymenobacter sp. B81]|uniref:phage capsid protein n=1 Tax=Hymenobacter sp. B81 TaxID=3344878 RepID=UPI0037DCE2B0